MKLNELLNKYGNIEITEDQEQEIKNKLGIKTKKAWKPKLNERYWYVTDGGRAEAQKYLMELEDSHCNIRSFYRWLIKHNYTEAVREAAEVFGEVIKHE